jgi:hypothetical protein
MEDISEKVQIFLNTLGCSCGCGQNRTSDEFAQTLFFAQGVYGKPFVITSAYRCPQYNAKVGGVLDSPSIYGQHADIAYDTPQDLFLMFKALIGAGFERFRIYPHHLHVDRHPKWPQPSFMWANYPPKIKPT